MSEERAPYIASTEAAPKRRRGPGKPWVKGQSGNPNGRPKEHASWAAIFQQVSELTPAEIVDAVGRNSDLGRAYRKMPQDVKVRFLVAVRVVAALMFDPSGSLLNVYMERADGRLPQPITLPDGFPLTIVWDTPRPPPDSLT